MFENDFRVRDATVFSLRGLLDAHVRRLTSAANMSTNNTRRWSVPSIDEKMYGGPNGAVPRGLYTDGPSFSERSPRLKTYGTTTRRYPPSRKREIHRRFKFFLESTKHCPPPINRPGAGGCRRLRKKPTTIRYLVSRNVF